MLRMHTEQLRCMSYYYIQYCVVAAAGEGPYALADGHALVGGVTQPVYD